MKAEEPLNELRTRFSNLWQTEPGDELKREASTCLAMLQGYIERCLSRASITNEVVRFLAAQIAPIASGHNIDLVGMENFATSHGLPTCSPEDRVVEIQSYFGVVGDACDDGLVRVNILDAADVLPADGRVPLIWLPKAFRNAEAPIAWVERQYEIGTIGRFEPGGEVV